MPDLRGLSARAAVRRARRSHCSPRLNGDGFVIEQQPAAGTPLDTRCHAVWLGPRRRPRRQPMLTSDDSRASRAP